MPDNLFAKSPKRIKNSSEKATTIFELATDRHAIHRAGSEPKIESGEPSIESPLIGPVYSIGQSGDTAIPTGRVFVRFKSDVKANDRKRQIEDAGYEIVETVSYAPEAAWIRAASGEIAESLNGIGKLEKLADVENVEPQMLMERTSR